MTTNDRTVLSPRELQAIEEHKYYMSQKQGREVTIEEAITDFLQTYADNWRKAKMRRDMLDQIQEIERHKYLRSQAEGRDIGRAAAAEEWCAKYAKIWRQERESLERNGFSRVAVIVENPNGIHMRPSSELAEISRRYDADVYVHKEGMEFYNFRLRDRPYMNVKSVLGMLSMGIKQGDSLEFIATGTHAPEVLKVVAHAVNAPTPQANA
jgi:phosphotransferase system HPr (HPr) family protein